MTYEDEIFTFVPDSNACFKIIRTWKVIDWCAFDRWGNYMQYVYQQIIKVSNSEAPEVISGCEEKTICTYDPDCLNGYIELIALADDDCTPGRELLWHLQIDLNDDGILETDLRGKGDSINASDAYPIGRHRIKYSFEDLCGNKGTCTTYFEITNCKLPTAYCLNGIAVDLMPQDTNNDGTIDWGMIEIWASDLNLGSFHCNNDITFSFSSDTTDKARMFDCDSLGMRNVEMWVTDRVTGNQTYCRTHVIIQDNNDACPDTMTVQAQVAGLILDDEGRPLESVELILTGGVSERSATDEDGNYAFSGIPVGNDYTVQPMLDGDAMDGVSTFDLVEIQRHLLGMDTIRNPYKHIAADVDRNRQISAKDMLFLRRMILGLERDFGGLPAWRFVQRDYQFADPADPLKENFPEMFDIRQLPGNMMYVDFTGVKLGDLNGSYTRLQGEVQSRNAVVLDVETRQGVYPGLYEVILSLDQDQLLAGMQFTLEYEADRWYWTGEWDASGKEDGAAAIAEVWPGQISFSWMAPQPSGKFELRLVLSGDEELPRPSISSQITRAEAYRNDGMEYPLTLRSRTSATESEMRVTPNPFYDMVTLTFDLPEHTAYDLVISDMAGRRVIHRSATAVNGPDQELVYAGQLPAQGVYYAEIRASGVKMIQKMVFIPSR